MTFAHVGGVPVEEALMPLTTGAAAGLLMARAWLASHKPFRRARPRSGSDPSRG